MKKIVVVHRGNSDNNKILSFVSRCSHLGCMSRRFECILLGFICDWLLFNSCDWCISILAVPVSCCLSRPLLRSSPVVGEDSGPLFRSFLAKKADR